MLSTHPFIQCTIKILHYRNGDKSIASAKQHTLQKVMIWIAAALVAILVTLLPVVLVTGMFGGDSLARSIALLGVLLLAFGAAWLVRGQASRF